MSLAGNSDIAALVEAVLSGSRRGLARAITLIESSRADHRDDAEALLAQIMSATGGAKRIGVTGTPGVGKSTFIEAFGTHVTEHGHRIAVLAVDPSSRVSGGSILGDKTRMESLSRNPAAFIRPSPAGETLGGVARRTRETILLCEAAGFDTILVETVGVGQSETTVADMTDMFLLLLQPGSGDELQGLKKGIVELADMILVNKADGALEAPARRSAAEYHGALRLLHSGHADWTVPVETCSAETGAGIAEAWEMIGSFFTMAEDTGRLRSRRRDQARAWLGTELNEECARLFRSEAGLAKRLEMAEQDVVEGRVPAAAAARSLVQALVNTRSRDSQ